MVYMIFDFYGFYAKIMQAVVLVATLGSGWLWSSHCIDDAEDLIEAILDANEDNEDRTIDLCGNTIVLTQEWDGGFGLPGIGTPDSDYVLTIKNGTIERAECEDYFGLLLVNENGKLRLYDLILANGYSEAGGALLNNGLVEDIEDTSFINNIGFFGGAIFNSGEILRIKDSFFYENLSFVGGAILNVGYMEDIIESALIENGACFGGGIFNCGYIDTIFESAVALNEAQIMWCYYNETLDKVRNDKFGESHGEQVLKQFIETGVRTENDPPFPPGEGGGIYNLTLINQIENSIVADNEAEFLGGGIFNGFFFFPGISLKDLIPTAANDIDNSTIQSITNSSIVFNDAEYGGGIFNFGDIPLFSGNTVARNTASEDGGGIYNGYFYYQTSSLGLANHNTPLDYGTITLFINSTVSGNSAEGSGGGIYNETLIENLSNSTISDNAVIDDDDDNAYGGGIYNETGAEINLVSTIVAGNRANGEYTGDDIYDTCAMSSQDATSALYALCVEQIDFVQDGGNNLIGSNDANYFVPGTPNSNWSYVGTYAQIIDPRLGVLDNYGGPTDTMPLFSNSPAIGAGANPFELDFDQRGEGFPRETFGFADIGAFQTPQVGPEGPEGPQGEPGEDGSDGQDGGSGFGGGGTPLPWPPMPVAPVAPAAPMPKQPVDDGTAGSLGSVVEQAPRAPSEDMNSPSTDVRASGCSLLEGPGQEGNALLMLMIVMLGFVRGLLRKVGA